MLEALEYLGFENLRDFELVRDSAGLRVVWLSSKPQPTHADIDAARLSASKLLLRDAVDAERARREAAGCPVEFPDGAGVIQTRDATDFRNVTGQATAAIILQSQGVTSPVLSFRDAGNVDHAMTPAQMIGVAMAVQSWVADLYVKSRAIKAQIDAAPDQAALDAIDITQGWA